MKDCRCVARKLRDVPEKEAAAGELATRARWAASMLSLLRRVRFGKIVETRMRCGAFQPLHVAECQAFPNGEHDDTVDVFTQAVAVLRDQTWLRVDPPAEDDGYERGPRVNPYAA